MPARFQTRQTPSAQHLQKPKRLLRLLNFYQRCDDMLMFSVIATALLMSMALLPAYGAAAAPKAAEIPSAKHDRLPSDPVTRACSGQAWGHEIAECLIAITRDGGRDEVRTIRIVATEPDSKRPNIF